LETGSPLETEWSRLREQIRLVQDRFWFGIVVADPLSAAKLLNRASGEMALHGKPVALIAVKTPTGFEQALSQLSDPHPDRTLIWITGFGLGQEWVRGWSTFLARLNERRDWLTRQFQCGLVVVGDEGLNELVRDSATDLWAVSSVTVHVARTVESLDANTFVDQNLRSVSHPFPGGSNFEILVSKPIAEALKRAQRALAVSEPAQALEIIDRALAAADNQSDRAALFAAASRASVLSGDPATADEFAARALATPLALGKRDQLVLWDRRQEFAFIARRLQEALASANAACAIAEELVETTGTIEARRDLAITLDNRSRVRFAAEDLQGAIVDSRTSFDVRQRLANATGTNEARRDLSVSLTNLAVLESALGHVDLAREKFQLSLDISQQLSSVSMTSEAMRDLAVGCANVARTDIALGNPTLARSYLYRALRIFHLLLDRIGITEAQRDLAIALGNVAELELVLASRGRGLANFRQALKIAERLASLSNGIETQGDLSHALRNLGKVSFAIGNLTEARTNYRRAIKIAVRLADSIEQPWYLDRAASVARELIEVLKTSDPEFETEAEDLDFLARGCEIRALEIRTRQGRMRVGGPEPTT
jgi:tetratricopeptide (TPR) repeat protein